MFSSSDKYKRHEVKEPHTTAKNIWAVAKLILFVLFEQRNVANTVFPSVYIRFWIMHIHHHAYTPKIGRIMHIHPYTPPIYTEKIFAPSARWNTFPYREVYNTGKECDKNYTTWFVCQFGPPHSDSFPPCEATVSLTASSHHNDLAWQFFWRMDYLKYKLSMSRLSLIFVTYYEMIWKQCV